MTNSDTGRIFTDEAQRYDATVGFVDPCYSDMHDMLLKLAVESSLSMPKVPILTLDIGSGTGADAMPILQSLPGVRLVGVDSSEVMNGLFRQRASKAGVSHDRFHLIHADILQRSAREEILRIASQATGEATFQVIISSLTLHHFTKAQKAEVFQLIYDLLAPGGVFLLGDLFNYDGESSWLSKTISDWEVRWFTHNFEEAAKAQQDAQEAQHMRDLKDKWLRHYLLENMLDSVTTQLNMLRAVGFREAGNPFRYWQVGLVCARK